MARHGEGSNGATTKEKKMRKYDVKITGKTPLLLHHDNIPWADQMDEWKNNPENKAQSKAGDDRTPAFRWIGCCYSDGVRLVIPQGNIMRALMEGGAMVPVPGGKNGKTFKAQSQSGMMSDETDWPIMVDGNEIPWGDIESLITVKEFSEHIAEVRRLGFDLLTKRAKVGTAKHIRVRPKFHAGWQISGHISVWDDAITTKVLRDIFDYAGQYKGLGDWRPGGKTPGPYGMFGAEVKEA